ncbi:hypothetical protein SEA_NEOS5_66 [Mycobacterium phage Neos5]|nr:hypothetical protein SEA_NEOS5_66 [Mycobacterium phage Neos5]UYL86519.1 hypothetical protein SEA_BRIAKILA_66 [Mycobacterium phage Briakila]
MATKRTETLEQFSASLDEHAGRSVGFADAVRDLRIERALKAEVDARRKALYEALVAHHDRGVTRLSSGLVLRRTRPSPPSKRVVVDTALVKRRYPKIHSACRVPVPYLQVRGAVVVPRWDDPGTPTGTENVDRVADMYGRAVMPDDVKARGEAAKELLIAAADEFGWDGLPLEFADGWAVGLRRIQFDVGVLRATHPDVAASCSVEKVSGGSAPRVYVAKPGEADVD